MLLKRKALRIWQSKYQLVISPLALLLLDQLSKAWVRATIPLGESRILIPALGRSLRIVHIDNPAAAFGLLGEEGAPFITLFGFVAIGLILFFYPRIAAAEPYMRWAFGFLLAGFTGNLIDRLWQGYVTDIFVVLLPNAFNIADLANLAGFLVLLIGYLEESGEEQKNVEKSKP
ncbi:MAG: signal peptidase II [Candidatus Hadarchaeum sp.]